MSLFITFEGIEGSGKTTQIGILNEVLKLRGYETLLTREPGGTPIGEEIRKILLHSENKGMVPLCELFLYAAQRAQHFSQVIGPALKQGKIVLCDRFIDATMAYQGYARGFPLELIQQFNDLALEGAKPHLTFLLDCDIESGLNRAVERNALKNKEPKALNEERFENEPLDFHKKVREGYLALAQKEFKRMIVVAASRDKEQVHQDILKHTLARLI